MNPILLFCLVALSRCEVVVDFFGNCEENNSDIIKLNSSFGLLSNGTQYVNLTADILDEVGNDIRYVLAVATSTDGKKFRRGLNIREKNYCSSFSKNLGAIWRGIEIRANIPHGKCPLPKRQLEIFNYPLKMNVMGLDRFPKGILKVTSNAYRANTKHSIICLRGTILLK